MVTLIGEEGGEFGRRILGIVVHEFGIGEEVAPVVLLVVAVDSQILLQGLVCPLYLYVGLGVVCRRAIPLDVA